jgi:hypothetical protein
MADKNGVVPGRPEQHPELGRRAEHLRSRGSGQDLHVGAARRDGDEPAGHQDQPVRLLPAARAQQLAHRCRHEPRRGGLALFIVTSTLPYLDIYKIFVNCFIIISLLITPLLAHVSSLWISYKEKGS